jgi:hypothetical protein
VSTVTGAPADLTGHLEGTMRQSVSRSAFLLGLIVGLVFGVWNLLSTWRRPLEDDSAAVLLQFYGPMFLIWMFASFRVAGRTGRVLPAVAAGIAVAFGTFLVFVLLNALRVNLFLDQLTGRPDWQNMMTRFRESGPGSLRWFVNLDYLKGTPFKIGFFTALGSVIGCGAACVGCLTRRLRGA